MGLSIDEAIAHWDERARYYEGKKVQVNNPSEAVCVCADESKQLAEWLRELKQYRAVSQKWIDDANRIDEIICRTPKRLASLQDASIWALAVAMKHVIEWIVKQGAKNGN